MAVKQIGTHVQHDVAPAPLEVMLGAIARGDAAAFELFFAATWSGVRDRAAIVLRDLALAEEVAQEVLIEVWRTAPRFDPARGSAMAWLMTMTQRRSIDRVRREHASRRRDHESVADPAVGELDDVADVVITSLNADAMRASLSVLSPLQRQAVTMAFYGGLTYREVATQLDVPLSTTKTRIRDGLLRLSQAAGREPATRPTAGPLGPLRPVEA